MVIAAHAAPRVWVVLAEEGGVHAEAAAVLRAEIGGEAELVEGTPSAVLDARQSPPELIVAIGAAAHERAMSWLAGRGADWARVPVLATLLPRATFEALQANGGRGTRAVSAVVLDQPLGRQLALIGRALPDRRRVAVLPGPQTRPLLAALEKEAAARGLRLFAAPAVNAAEGIYPSLKEALAGADVLLALPDPLVYNGASLQHILLASYRARVPLVAFSPAYVKAGALLAVYSTPAQVARHAAGMAHDWLAGRGLPPPQSPREFAVVANPRVAASLGLLLDDAALIAEDLRRAEERQ
jgi:ABC-type uncharacterized transport system substrate-binding protein